MEPIERIARDVRVIRRIIELLVVLGLVVSLLAAWDLIDDPGRPAEDPPNELCEEFPQFTGC